MVPYRLANRPWDPLRLRITRGSARCVSRYVSDMRSSNTKGEQFTTDVRRHHQQGNTNVPSILLTLVSVTTSNIQNTVVADGFRTIAQIHTPDYMAACALAGPH